MQYELGRILEKRCYNSICLFCGVIIGVCESWYNTSARLGIFEGWYDAFTKLIAGLTNSEAIGRAVGKIIDETNYRATIKAIDKAVCRATGETNYGNCW